MYFTRSAGAVSVTGIEKVKKLTVRVVVQDCTGTVRFTDVMLQGGSVLPLFEQFMPMEQLIASFAEFIPFIHTKLDVVLYNAFPFNVLKGLVISIVTMLVYKRLRPALKGAVQERGVQNGKQGLSGLSCRGNSYHGCSNSG